MALISSALELTEFLYMSEPQDPKPAKLLIGIFLKSKGLAEEIVTELSSQLGPLDIVSPWFSFDFTKYYEKEMGTPLFRRMFAFKNLIRQDRLAGIKLWTNSIEKHYLNGKERKVNIDPGYMLLERFVLATGKNFTHRIYIGKQIYADLTLIYQKGAFRKLPWTYPDYSAKDMIAFLELVRKKYYEDLKHPVGNHPFQMEPDLRD